MKIYQTDLSFSTDDYIPDLNFNRVTSKTIQLYHQNYNFSLDSPLIHPSKWPSLSVPQRDIQNSIQNSSFHILSNLLTKNIALYPHSFPLRHYISYSLRLENSYYPFLRIHIESSPFFCLPIKSYHIIPNPIYFHSSFKLQKLSNCQNRTQPHLQSETHLIQYLLIQN